ncbi:hypothetical protein [Sandaracinus amylolyticus]|uniref:Uncharacterized protein n=1 Tax=Sandaracinus amylolyticus TaxID=927083 RepID=A0A0F6YMT4_9BACT|nr:hypothetical protein [Sandaracinus amylolyticus]AKF11060.1 hypothetical protein DB32_008209 [Sandaracinus amylolyticus]
MSAARAAAAATTPSVFTHQTRAEWGRAVIAEALPDRTKYVFEHAGERTFMNGHTAIRELELPEGERESLARQLLRRPAPTSAASKKKASRSKSAAEAPPAEPTVTFERQQAIFASRFADGFAGARYVREERGTLDGDERHLDALIALARELLSAERLDAALARGAHDEVFADATKVLGATDALAFPKPDRPAFQRVPETAHADVARTLRELLHGSEPYDRRFDAFVRSLGSAHAPWTIATIFSAAVHPDAHVLVKPTVSQRQARVLGLTAPPIGAPTGAAYGLHLAVARTLRDRLVEAGHTPRDLFDVYTYEWRTLSKGALASSPD